MPPIEPTPTQAAINAAQVKHAEWNADEAKKYAHHKPASTENIKNHRVGEREKVDMVAWHTVKANRKGEPWEVLVHVIEKKYSPARIHYLVEPYADERFKAGTGKPVWVWEDKIRFP